MRCSLNVLFPDPCLRSRFPPYDDRAEDDTEHMRAGQDREDPSAVSFQDALRHISAAYDREMSRLQLPADERDGLRLSTSLSNAPWGGRRQPTLEPWVHPSVSALSLHAPPAPSTSSSSSSALPPPPPPLYDWSVLASNRQPRYDFTAPPPTTRVESAHRVYILHCASCGTFLTDRGMRVRFAFLSPKGRR